MEISRHVCRGPWRVGPEWRGAEWHRGWAEHPAVTHGCVPAGREGGESPRGRRGALGITYPLNGVPRKHLFIRLLQNGFGFL